MRTINPTTEQPLEHYPEHSPAEVDRLIRDAATAFQEWRRTSFGHRGTLMRHAGEELRKRKADLSRSMTLEMGKPIAAAEAEIEKCAAACDYFAEHSETYLQPRNIRSDAMRSYVRYDPLGPVLAIMPWNFPFWQVFRFAAPGLMAGNVGLLKHAENVPGCAAAIGRVFTDAGFPRRIFTTLMIDRSGAEAVIRHPVVAAVTLTGSDRAGRAVALQAGSELKKAVLELGGSDAFIVLEDADIEKTAQAAAEARCINSGQSCIAAKRFIVVGKERVRPFTEAFVAAMERLKVGDPLDRATQIGPQARLDLLQNLHRQVEQTIAAGARLLTGGRRLDRTGYFYPPTVLAEVKPGMPAFDEETFGPVAAVIEAADENDAVRLSNTSRFGLGCSLWTNDPERADRLAPKIEAGCVFINGPVKSDPRLPFGGIKQSGFGRELAEEGIREFCNIKTVWCK